MVHKLFFCEKTFNLFIFNHGGTKNDKGNKNYNHIHGSSDVDYKH